MFYEKTTPISDNLATEYSTPKSYVEAKSRNSRERGCVLCDKATNQFDKRRSKERVHSQIKSNAEKHVQFFMSVEKQ